MLPGPEVDLMPFWTAYYEIEQEHLRRGEYDRVATFWESYDAKLRNTHDLLRQTRTDMELNTGWSNPENAGAASTAFYERVDAGIGSIRNWLYGGPGLLDGGTDAQDVGTGGVAAHFRELVNLLDGHFRTVMGHRDTLLKQFKVDGALTVGITAADRGRVEVRPWAVAPINDVVTAAMRLRDDLRGKFEVVTRMLGVLPYTEMWRGPTTVAAVVPPGGPASAAAGPMNAAGPGGPGAPPGAGPAATATAPSTPEPNADQTGGPAAEPTAAEPTAADPTATDPTATDPSVSDPAATGPITDPVTDPSAMDPAADSSMPELPPTDPELAGTPTATATPTSSLPGSTTGPLPSSVPSGPSIPIGSGPSSTASPPLTPIGSPLLPSQAFAPPRRDGAEPLPPASRNSTVDGSRGGVPIVSAPGESAAVPRGGTAGASSSTGVGPGFYPPPILPPMGAGAGGGAGGIRPGEADFAAGPVRQVRGPDSWRAGLRPQLLGRAGDRDDEQDDFSPSLPPPGGEVLDEELWQVPGAAPATPPEPQQRRGRSSWGT